MIFRTIFRMLWVVVAFCLAVAVALAVLFALGAMWTGDALRAAAPNDPLLRDGAPIFGMVLFAGTVTPALNALPALIGVAAGEVLRIRSWMYYVLAGGASLAAIPILAAPDTADLPRIIASPYMTIFAAAGFAGGFVYWLLAGARA
ncbi:MAG: hypothetical protein A2W02_00425 [Alphaproteobacteria bacterium RBG_16_64_48]|nr:MAG: hypothetical protein A2W02_00425 [Alphaproteobacteria bacterium RBG_16_64_48]